MINTDKLEMINTNLFQKKKNNQNYSYRNQGKSNTSFNIKIHNFLISILNTHSLLLSATDNNNATIPNKILKINAQSLNFGLFVYKGTIIAAPNHPAERLTNRSDNTCSQTVIYPLYHNWQKGFIRITKKSLITMLAAWLVIVSSGLLYMFGPWVKEAKAAWFNDNWAYRTPLNFTHNADVSDTKVKFDIDTASLTTDKLQADCGDSRFTDINGNLLRYFIDEAGGACDGVSTDYYVLIPTIVNGSNTIFHYYGNPSASNGTEAAQFSEATTTPSGAISGGSEEKGPGPSVYWKFDEGYGTTSTSDQTLNNLDGTLNNTPTWQTEDQCIAEKCLFFNGTTDMNVSKSDDPLLDFVAADNFTIQAWVKRNGASSANNFILTKAASGYTGYKLYQDASGDYCFDVSDGTNTDTACTSAVEFDDDQWHYVVGTKQGTTAIKLYVDGKERASDASIAATGTLANTGTFYVGVDLDGTSNEWLGFIDEVKVYRDNAVRTAAQIAADFNSRGTSKGVGEALGANTQNNPDAFSDGLVGYWKEDETSTAASATDSSGNSSTLTDSGSTTRVAGKFGNGGDFELGSSQYQFSADNAVLSVTESLTLSAWIKPETVSAGTYNIISKWDGLNESYRLYQSADELVLEIETGNTVTTDAANLAAATLYHVVGIYDAVSATAKIYVNGVESTTTIGGTIPTSIGDDAGAFSIGAEDRNNTPKNFYDGIIDEARVYNRALSSADISSLYTFAPGPVGYWNFDENTGTAANDLSGNANSGTLTNTPTWTTGKYGAGISFAGSNAHVIVSDPASGVLDFADDADFTYSAWIKHTTASARQIILSKFADAGPGYKLSMEADGDIQCGLDYDTIYTPTDSATSTAATYDDNKWHYVACVKTGASTLSLYIDGVLIVTDSALTAANAVSNTDPLYIGIDEDGTSNDFVGQIDEPKIYNYARTPRQVVEDMNAGHPAPGSPVGSPIGWYKFDEGQGTTANNSGSGGSTLNGTLKENWAQVGNGLSVTITGAPALAALNSTDVAFIDNVNDSLRTYRFDGTDWAQVGNSLSIVSSSTQALAALNSTDVAFTDDGTDSLRTYRFDGTDWAQVGNALSTSSPISPTIAALNSTDVAYIEANGGDDIRTYRFDGTDWAQVGNALIISNIDLFVESSMAALNSTDVAFIDGTNDRLQIYRWDGTDWILVGGNGLGIPGSFPALTALNSTDVAFIDLTNASLRTYRFDGAVWAQVGNGLSVTTTGAPALAALNSTDVAFIDTTNDSLRTYRFSSMTTNSGKFGKALNFNGSDDVVTVTNATAIDLNVGLAAAHTFCAWTNADTDGEADTGQIYQKGTTTYLRVDSESGSNLDVEASLDLATTDATLNISAAITTSSWNHICVSYEDDGDDEITIYINGINRGSSTDGSGAPAADANNLSIGGTTTANFDGTIDEFKVYNSALTVSQVQQDMNRGAQSVLGALSDNSTYQVAAANQEYCVPGDTTSCAAPVGEWKLDEKTGITANDTSGNYSLILSAAAWTTGKFGAAWDGNGARWLNGGNYSDFDFAAASNFTISLWVKSDSSTNPGANEYLIDKEAGIGYAVYFDTSGQLVFGIDDDATWTPDDTATAATDYYDGLWHYVTAIKTGTTKIEIYVDGRLLGSDSTIAATGTLANSDSLIVGGQNISDDGDEFFGNIDMVRIFNYARTAAQVAWDYNRGGPAGWWKLDECQGTTAYDASVTNANNGTWSGSTGGNTSVGNCTTVDTATAWYNGRTGKLNSSLDFDGTDDVVTVTNATSIDLNDNLAASHSFSAWIYPNNAGEGSGGQVYWKGATTYLRVDTLSGSNLDVEASLDLATTDATVNVSAPITTNSWNHIVVIYTDDADDEIDVYINGRLRGSSANGDGAPAADTNNLLIGGTTTDNFDGQIDDFRVYNYALTATQIKLLMNNSGAIRYSPVTGSP